MDCARRVRKEGTIARRSTAKAHRLSMDMGGDRSMRFIEGKVSWNRLGFAVIKMTEFVPQDEKQPSLRLRGVCLRLTDESVCDPGLASIVAQRYPFGSREIFNRAVGFTSTELCHRYVTRTLQRASAQWPGPFLRCIHETFNEVIDQFRNFKLDCSGREQCSCFNAPR